ncbi:hypothetical protein G6F56_010523 [Rhizopus delemar]|uniref:Uncharacterized protein n=1 Tax=Rhizopus stolonifer TaxID=4846 RepID=A0A367IJA6_RHIST|nr:hypothetical protein G6F56_010523 [Rhizopus delemar]RCH77601.1 hypothetical protein CU098_006173 [Rhizopus stolonifer]
MITVSSSSILNSTKGVVQIWMPTNGRDHKDFWTAILVNGSIRSVEKYTFNSDNNLVTARLNINGIDYDVTWTRSKDAYGAHNWSVNINGWTKGKLDLIVSSRSWSSPAGF